MIYDFEYDGIINHWETEYEMNVTEIERNILIQSYKVLTQLFGEDAMSFDTLVEKTLLDLKWDKKYPGLDLYDRVYGIHNLN